MTTDHRRPDADYSARRSRRIRLWADDTRQVLSDHPQDRCETSRRLSSSLLPPAPDTPRTDDSG